MQHRSLIAILFAASAGVLACGDNHGAPDAFNVITDGSAGVDAPPAGSANPNAFVVAGDFTAGDPGVGTHVVASVPPTVDASVAPAGAVGDDPVVRLFGPDLIVVNRADGNNVTLLDAKTFALIQQVATGSGTNPQDVTIADGKLYVPIYGGSGGNGVEVLTLGSAASQKLINLGSDDPDGKPNCSSVFTVGTDVYVTCQLLDDTNANLPPRGSGEVYVIDSGSDAVRAKFALQTANPVGLLEASGDGNLVTSTVDFATGSGCVEKISVGATPTSACIADNTLLGGFASRVQFDTSQLMIAAVEDASFHGTLVTYDLATAVTPLSGSNENIGDVAVCPNGTLIAADVTTGSAGIRLFSVSEELTTGPSAVGLPPDAAHGLVCY